MERVAVVGIDLGTTTSLLSTFIPKSNAAVVIENNQGTLFYNFYCTFFLLLTCS